MTKHIYSHLTTKRMLGKIALFTCLFLCLTLCRKHIDFKDAGTWQHLSDKRTIEGYTRVGDKIYGGHYYGKSIWDAIKPMKYVDAKTFSVCIGSEDTLEMAMEPTDTICSLKARKFRGASIKARLI